jgi:hypothetical protein
VALRDRGIRVQPAAQLPQTPQQSSPGTRRRLRAPIGAVGGAYWACRRRLPGARPSEEPAGFGLYFGHRHAFSHKISENLCLFFGVAVEGEVPHRPVRISAAAGSHGSLPRPSSTMIRSRGKM